MPIHRRAYFLHTNIQQRISHVDFLNSKWKTSRKCENFLLPMQDINILFPLPEKMFRMFIKNQNQLVAQYSFLFLVRCPQVSTRYFYNLQGVSSNASTWNHFMWYSVIDNTWYEKLPRKKKEPKT